MTVRGGVCLVADCFVLILALGSGIRSLHVAALLLSFFLLFSLLSLILAAATLRVESDIRPNQLQREQTVEYRFSMEGWVLLPVVGHLTIMPPGAHHKQRALRQRHAFFLHPSWRRWQRVYQVELACNHRGFWAMGPELLRLQDIFGLFSLPIIRHGQVQPEPVTLCVLPQVHPLNGRLDAHAATDGFAAALIRNASSGELFGDTRQYQDGDPIKRVHWKQSARTGKLHIRQFEAQENPQVLVLLDLCCAGDDTVALADIATEIAASLAHRAVMNGKTLQLLPVRPAEGSADGESCWLENDRDLDRLLERLADVQFYAQPHPLEPSELRDMRYMGAGTVYVVTEQPSDALADVLLRMKKAGQRVFCIVPSAGELTPTAAALTEDAERRPVVVRSTAEITEKVGDCQ